MKNEKEFKELRDGSVLLNLDFQQTEIVDKLFLAAVAENKINLKELFYQFEGSKRSSFKKLVVAAFINRCSAEYLKKFNKKAKQ